MSRTPSERRQSYPASDSQWGKDKAFMFNSDLWRGLRWWERTTPNRPHSQSMKAPVGIPYRAPAMTRTKSWELPRGATVIDLTKPTPPTSPRHGEEKQKQKRYHDLDGAVVIDDDLSPNTTSRASQTPTEFPDDPTAEPSEPHGLPSVSDGPALPELPELDRLVIQAYPELEPLLEHGVLHSNGRCPNPVCSRSAFLSLLIPELQQIYREEVFNGSMREIIELTAQASYDTWLKVIDETGVDPLTIPISPVESVSGTSEETGV
ncbi:hypothetical protein BDV25DRAFT_136239 [Aspergillus avenaceus]|uniref:Uncharacterized protein n=1 Tax=Aspergillus avenaceus TaxID=36643 RepID=A0A5N6U619_ASPAV|nr:hypothetical protein BDV25DRAFT_136239 [Aspergillus avenaceus]